MHKRAFGVVAVALAVSATAILGGCGGGGDSDATDATDSADTKPTVGDSISVSAKEFAFDPSKLSVAADTAFTVEFANDGTMEHDFAVEGEDSDTIVAAAGSDVSGTFTLAAGTYKFFCSVPGHEANGMVGTLTVE